MTHDTNIEDDDEIVPSTVLDDHIVVVLNKPIPCFKDQLMELRMRRPTVADMLKVGGNPVILKDDHCVHEPVFMSRMIALLTQFKKGYGIPVSSIEKMDVSDWESAAWSLNSFFIPSPRKRAEES